MKITKPRNTKKSEFNADKTAGRPNAKSFNRSFGKSEGKSEGKPERKFSGKSSNKPEGRFSPRSESRGEGRSEARPERKYAPKGERRYIPKPENQYPPREQNRTEGQFSPRSEGRDEGRSEGRFPPRTGGRNEGRSEGRFPPRSEGRSDGRSEGRFNSRPEGRGNSRPFAKDRDRDRDSGSERSFGKKPFHRGEKRHSEKNTTRPDGNSMWLWGIHAVEAAINNPNREIYEVIATKNSASHLPEGVKVRVVEPEDLTYSLPPNSVHQGLAARVKPLPEPDYDAVLKDGKLVFILDQLTDPQNIGSIFRTAAAFGASAIIQQDRKAPTITGALAKAAQGGVEIVPDLRVVNISQTLVELSEQGWLCVGLDMEGSAGPLSKVLEGETRPVAIVLGAEGKGIRSLVSERCDTIAHIPMPGNMESLNVSNAAAIAAYEVIRGK